MRAGNAATSRGLYVRFLITAFVLSAALGITRDGHFLESERLARPLEAIPASMDGWSMTGDEALAPDVLEQLKPSSYLLRSYSKSGSLLGLFVVFYGTQRSGTMHSP